jgi:hypothetical protein
MKQLLYCTRNFLVALFPEEGTSIEGTPPRYHARLDARWTFFFAELGKARADHPEMTRELERTTLA